MASADRWYLIVITLFAIIAFMPWARTVEVGGMSMFGWLMALLMVFSPAIALVQLLIRKNRGDHSDA
ncbi:MAG: hypothetical protein CMG71_07630 [Candidatus Marinimicrobia bacterium]|nr:hypothetical protein [Candidatus Neomarinimicrobiota bacterium]|tara:strand:- start:244 stop:444 length:201 start_codon:yes stop_codon:yes gene_type:complete